MLPPSGVGERVKVGNGRRIFFLPYELTDRQPESPQKGDSLKAINPLPRTRSWREAIGFTLI